MDIEKPVDRVTIRELSIGAVPERAKLAAIDGQDPVTSPGRERANIVGGG
jgi:hypothetical protein